MATRRASTLIELIVVIAVIGMMAAIIIPAIQSAREAARANSCINNLRQTGIGLSNYVTVRGHFPMGAKARFEPKVGGPSVMFDVSWWADTIGFMGESAMSDELDRKGANVGWIALNAHNGDLVDGYSPDFWRCPSSPIAQFANVTKYKIAIPSYSGISGAADDGGFGEKRIDPAALNGRISAGGALIQNEVVSPRQIQDGMSKTLLVGEQSDFAYTDSGGAYTVASGGGKGWLAGTRSLFTPPDLVDPLAYTHNVTTVRYQLNERRYSLPGVFFDGGANNQLISPHPGRVHLLYCDGSVHAAADSMESKVLKSLATRDDEPDFVD